MKHKKVKVRLVKDIYNAGYPPEIIESIEQGLKDADEGRVIPHAEVMKKYRKYLKK